MEDNEKQVIQQTEASATEQKRKPGASWKEGETHVLPENNLVLVRCSNTHRPMSDS